MHSRYLMNVTVRICYTNNGNTEKGNASLISKGLVLNLLLSITIGRSKNDASEVKILSFLICNSNG